MIQELYNQINTLPGYKIPKSHFRVGSKIHITDFYYAKRFFQNHFFASRFAFLLSQEILKSVSPKDVISIKLNGLSLIGYGIYSELLLSLVKKFLSHAYAVSPVLINHNIVKDSQELELMKEQKLHQNCIIIVPIASTFSTTIKIEETLKEKKANIKFLPPHYNLLWIANGDETTVINPIEISFGWKEKDPENKRIRLTAFYEDDNAALRTQKYFLCLPSSWENIESCKYCFPEQDGIQKPLNERPLLETDPASVTPTMIFDFPKGRVLEKQPEQKPRILPEYVQYGHHIRNNSHFIYSIDTESFLELNIDLVGPWLQNIRDEPGFSADFPQDAHVLLVSSCHHSNAAFLNLVNEVVFSSAANIIHYDPAQDYIQNFHLIYGREIATADKIVFVDDSLKTGATFSKINDFIRYTASLSGKSSKGFDACFFLINKTQPFTLFLVKEKLVGERQINAFCNAHLFTSLTSEESSPLIAEGKRYSQLLGDSFLDSLKIHFDNQAKKLAVELRKGLDLLKRERHLLMLEVTHRLYAYFSSPDFTLAHLDSFEDFAAVLLRFTSSPFDYTYRSIDENGQLSDRKTALLKVLTQSPFTHYEPLRQKVFKWILNLLATQRLTIEQKINDKNLTTDDFTFLKFLVRRAGLLNSNYLISEEFLKTLQHLYSPSGLPSLQKRLLPLASQNQKSAELGGKIEVLNDADISLNKVRAFHVFYAAQVKELLLQNEARSIRLERNLKFIGQGAAGYNQVVRILRMENSIVLQRFYEFIEKNDRWEKEIVDDVKPITDLLNTITIKKHHRFRALEEYFTETQQSPPLQNTAFLNYLWLQYFIKFDTNNTDTLRDKTDAIFAKLNQLLTYSGQERNTIAFVGAFLIVKDSAKNTFLAYNKNQDGRPQLDPDKWHNNDDKLLINFLNGIADTSNTYLKSVMEVERKDKGSPWIDMYAVNESEKRVPLSIDFLPEKINRLILLRLNKRQSATRETLQGIVGFYFRSESEFITDSSRVQYLIALRSALSSFVEQHHQNNEFRDWHLAERNKRLSLLAGHGKAVLQSLANKDSEFATIASNLAHLQTIIQLNETVKSNNGIEDIQKRFEQFYDVGGRRSINKKYFQHLRKLAKKIWAAKEIELPVGCKIGKLLVSDDFAFSFNKNILDVICFELILNAKKNRWHFLPGDKIADIKRNFLHIAAKKVNSSLFDPFPYQITISSLGPDIPDEVLRLMNNQNQSVKPDDAVGGTSLIKTLIWDILQGRLEYRTQPISEELKREYNICKISVTIYLREMESS